MYAKGALQADIDRVAEGQKLLAHYKAEGDLIKSLIKSREDLATAGMTEGQKFLHGIANRLPSQISAAHAARRKHRAI